MDTKELQLVITEQQRNTAMSHIALLQAQIEIMTRTISELRERVEAMTVDAKQASRGEKCS